MNRNRLDIRDKMPSGMEEYLSQNGWHFNKKLCEWAISNMWKLNSDGKKEHISITPKEEIKNTVKDKATGAIKDLFGGKKKKE